MRMIISIIRTVLLYGLILFSVRLMGKRQIGQMQTSELVVTLLMSNIATIPMQDMEQSMLSGVIPIMVLLAGEIFLSYLMLRKGGIRRLICGKPVIVIDKGTIDRNAMMELRLTTEDLFEQLRQKDIFDLNEVNYAIIETNGTMSVMKKPGCSPLCPDDVNMTVKDKELNVTVISDGETEKDSMNYCGLDDKKLGKILKKENVELGQVFIMTSDRSGNYRIIRKDEN